MSDLSTIRSEALDAVSAAADLAALDAVRVAALGKKGSVTGLMKTLGALPPEQRKEFGAAGQRSSRARSRPRSRRARATLGASALDARLAAEKVDVTLPARPEARRARSTRSAR